jgi:hypothetical protein
MSLQGQILVLIVLVLIPDHSHAQEKVSTIDPLTATSLLLETRSGELALAHGTGFLVEWNSKPYLISNTHVFSGLDSRKKPMDEKGRLPDQLRVWLHGKTLGNWRAVTEKLINLDGSARWVQPNSKIDVAALPLTSVPNDVQLYPLDLKLADADIRASVGMPAFVIGYPGGLSSTGSSRLNDGLLKFGMHAPGFPIWKAGHIATDPDLDYDGLPLMLIDATTRAGMSGSPVVLRSVGPTLNKQGQTSLKIGGTNDLFLGVYSAQYKDLELGHVWKPKVIMELLARIKQP